MLMMLKSTSPFWDRLKNMMRYPGHLDIDKTSVPFRTLIKKYLPDAPLNDGMIATREARTKLADKIEAVKNPSPHAQIEPKVKTVELVGANNPQSPASSPSLVQTAPAAEKPALAFDRLAPAWPWVVGAVTLIAIVMAALRRRS